MDSLLALPFQRLPRYELLLKTLIKKTERYHPDYVKLNEAFKAIKGVVVTINSKMNKYSKIDQL